MQENTILEFRLGNMQSYRLIFNELYSSMCLFSKKFLADFEDAEDIVQEVFIELWNQHSKFDSFEQIKAFLYTSIKNRCLNFKKKLIVREKFAKTTLASTELCFEEYVLETEVVQNINNAINNLSEQRKQIIILGMQGLKNNEIAEDLQISINTVKLQKKIAYSQLREKLKRPFLVLFLLF